MDRDGDSPKQNFHRCDRCHKWFADLQILEEHKRSDCDKKLPCTETNSPELPTRREMDQPQHSNFPAFASSSGECIEVKKSPTDKRVHSSPHEGTSKSPSEAVKTPPEGRISSKPKRSPRSPYSKVGFAPDIIKSIAEQELRNNPRRLIFLPDDEGTSKSPSKTSLEVSGKTTNSPGSSLDEGTSKSPKAVKTPPEGHISSKPKGSPYAKVHSPDLKRSISPCENSKSPLPAVSPKIIISPPAARKLNSLPDQGTSKSQSKKSPEVSSDTTNSPGSPDRDSSRSPCTKALKSAKTNRILAEQSWKEASDSAAHLTSLYEAATEKKEEASKMHADAVKLEDSLTVAAELKSFVSYIRKRASAELQDALKEERCALQSLQEARRVENFCRDAASAAAVHEGAILEAAKSYNTDRDKHSAGSPNRKASFSPDTRTSPSSCKPSTTPPSVVSSKAMNSPGSSSQVDLTQAFAATPEEKKIIEEFAKSVKVGDGHGTNLELKALEGDMKQTESDQTTKNDFPVKALDSVTEKDEELKQSNLEATNVLQAQGDKIDFTSESVAEKGKPIAESDKSYKAEGKGTNLELQALEGDMKQSESDQTSENDFPEKALDSVTEKDEELKQSNLEESTNVLHAQDDRIDFTSASVTHHGRWTQRQQSSLDDPDQHQAAEAATSSSHVAERLEQSDKSPESMKTTDRSK